jgi:hypothetical protein
VEDFLRHKDISHIYPQSDYPGFSRKWVHPTFSRYKYSVW